MFTHLRSDRLPCTDVGTAKSNADSSSSNLEINKNLKDNSAEKQKKIYKSQSREKEDY